MQKRIRMMGSMATLLLLATAGGARAQAKFGVAGGVTFPNGDLSNSVNSGFHVQANLDLRPARFPLGLRIDGGFAQLPFKGPSDLKLQQLYGTLDGKLVMQTEGLAPYLIAGVGIYGDRASGGIFDNGVSLMDDSWQAHFGVNGGVGLRLPLSNINVFVETRLHDVFVEGPNLQTVPVTFGIVF